MIGEVKFKYSYKGETQSFVNINTVKLLILHHMDEMAMIEMCNTLSAVLSSLQIFYQGITMEIELIQIKNGLTRKYVKTKTAKPSIRKMHNENLSYDF